MKIIFQIEVIVTAILPKQREKKRLKAGFD